MIRCFLIESRGVLVAAIDIARLEGTEAGKEGIVGLELTEGEGLCLVVFDEPEVGILSYLEDGFHGEREATVLLAVGKEVVSSCIAIEYAHRAVATRHMPHA